MTDLLASIVDHPFLAVIVALSLAVAVALLSGFWGSADASGDSQEGGDFVG